MVPPEIVDELVEVANNYEAAAALRSKLERLIIQAIKAGGSRREVADLSRLHLTQIQRICEREGI